MHAHLYHCGQVVGLLNTTCECETRVAVRHYLRGGDPLEWPGRGDEELGRGGTTWGDSRGSYRPPPRWAATAVATSGRRRVRDSRKRVRQVAPQEIKIIIIIMIGRRQRLDTFAHTPPTLPHSSACCAAAGMSCPPPSCVRLINERGGRRQALSAPALASAPRGVDRCERRVVDAFAP